MPCCIAWARSLPMNSPWWEIPWWDVCWASMNGIAPALALRVSLLQLRTMAALLYWPIVIPITRMLGIMMWVISGRVSSAVSFLLGLKPGDGADWVQEVDDLGVELFLHFLLEMVVQGLYVDIRAF